MFVRVTGSHFSSRRSHDMGAKSKAYRVSVSGNGGEHVSLGLELSQSFGTKGAHGWDFFETAEGDKLLVVPNYYGCGSTRGPTPEDAACRSTGKPRQQGTRRGGETPGATLRRCRSWLPAAQAKPTTSAGATRRI